MTVRAWITFRADDVVCRRQSAASRSGAEARVHRTLAQDSGIPVGTVRLTVGRHGSMKAGGRSDTTGRLHVPDSEGRININLCLGVARLSRHSESPVKPAFPRWAIRAHSGESVPSGTRPRAKRFRAQGWGHR
jgi:hypothetical protein